MNKGTLVFLNESTMNLNFTDYFTTKKATVDKPHYNWHFKNKSNIIIEKNNQNSDKGSSINDHFLR